jgi:DNA-binding MarR family transcriptional regulator
MIVRGEGVMATEDVSEMMAKECIAMRVRLLNRVVTKIYDDCLRPHGLRTAQLNILVAISLMKPATPSEIERRLHIEKSTVSRNVERMRHQGWVEFVPSEDGRSHHLYLTVQGAALLKKTTVAWEQAQKKAGSLLGKEGVTALSRLGVTRGAHAVFGGTK